MTQDGPIDTRKPEAPGQRKRPRRVLRMLVAILAGLSALAGLAFVVGFVQFASGVASAQAPKPPELADGIVVFTGGRDRVKGAVQLLDEGRAKRLLISGVHPSTTEGALASLSGGEIELFECCIDLGHNAQDTIGNANETAQWVRKWDYASLIVVTSNYHMARSLTELGRVLPDVRLEGYAVTTSSVDLEHWWRTPRAASLLLVEYVKLLAAKARPSATSTMLAHPDGTPT